MNSVLTQEAEKFNLLITKIQENLGVFIST